MTKRLSNDDVIANRELVLKLIEKNMEGLRRELVTSMLDGKTGDEFFTAPASSHEEYHYCFPGGLCAHSLNVVKELRTMAAAMAPDVYTPGTLLFVGLFHDLGKTGDGDEPFYIPNPDDYQRRKGRLYQINKKCQIAATEDRTIFVFQRNGIVLSPDEFLSIRLSDGQYVDTNKPYRRGDEPKLALLLHWADMWATRKERDSETSL